uniref:hypothetical protein n=1 Tax=Haloactinospora alba TaxID=405555 RepID=UPI001154B01F|nr:hypothetical protein [Haloactinospora alba]
MRLAEPAYTTMGCGQCRAGTTHALPLSHRTHTRTACGTPLPRDRNSARVTLVRAGSGPAGVDGVHPGRPLGARAA